MIEIRIHGRGGQGAVVASLVLAHAARRRGAHVQVFPEFGVERRGAPVTAFARLDGRPIRLRTRVLEPDHLIVLDAALLRMSGVTRGLRPGGAVVVNSDDPARAGEVTEEGFRVAWVDASAIAARHGIGTATAPIVNTTILGAFARATGVVSVEDVEAGIGEYFGPELAPRNAAAAREAAEAVAWAPLSGERALQRVFEVGP